MERSRTSLREWLGGWVKLSASRVGDYFKHRSFRGRRAAAIVRWRSASRRSTRSGRRSITMQSSTTFDKLYRSAGRGCAKIASHLDPHVERSSVLRALGAGGAGRLIAAYRHNMRTAITRRRFTIMVRTAFAIRGLPKPMAFAFLLSDRIVRAPRRSSCAPATREIIRDSVLIAAQIVLCRKRSSRRHQKSPDCRRAIQRSRTHLAARLYGRGIRGSRLYPSTCKIGAT